MTLVQVIGLVALGLFSALVGGVFLRLFWEIMRRGPSLAGSAYERGERIESWVDPSRNDALTQPALDMRHGVAIRFDREMGRHLVEERASTPEHI